MTHRTILCAAGLPLLAAASAPAAMVGFAGHSVRVDYVARLNPEDVLDVEGEEPTPLEIVFVAGSRSNVVHEFGSAAEYERFIGGTPTFDIDIDDASIRVFNFDLGLAQTEQFIGPAFFGLVFHFEDPLTPRIKDVTVDSYLPLAGGGALPFSVSHDGDTIELNWSGMFVSAATDISLGVSFVDPNEPTPAVPAPSAAAGGAALGAVLLLRRRCRGTPAAA